MKKIFLIAILLFTRPLSAHPLDLGLLQMNEAGPAIEVSLDLNPTVAAALLGREVTEMSQPVVDSRAAQLFAATLGSAPLTGNELPCLWTHTRAEVLPQTVRLVSRATCPLAGELHWSFPFLARSEMPSTFQMLVKTKLRGIRACLHGGPRPQGSDLGGWRTGPGLLAAHQDGNRPYRRYAGGMVGA